MPAAPRNLAALASSLALCGVACTAQIGPGGSQATEAAGSGGSAVAGAGGSSTTALPQDCSVPLPPSAPLRRLTRFEYNGTVRDLAKITSYPANGFPSEESGNGFGNDAKAQSVSGALAEKYIATAEQIAEALTAPERIAELAPCAVAPDAAGETPCARSVVDAFVPKAYRRTLLAGEADGLVRLFQTVRAGGASFVSSVAAVLEAALQGPEFLYRAEFGEPVDGRPDLLRPTGEEMATRLSYLLLGSLPDDALRAAAAAGELRTAEGVRAQAARLLEEPRAREVVRFFFDNLLPIQGLSTLERDRTQFPTYSAKIGSLLRQETQTFLENEIFSGPGTWPGVFTAPYTYLNEELAAFYGVAGVTGAQFRQVPLDGVRRAGLLTQAGILAGPIHSNHTNPVTRGSFVVQKLLCQPIPLPTGDVSEQVTPPDPYAAPTARERFTAHSTQPVCRGCHLNMDPVGFALENFDPVGQWRDQENGVTIDVTGESPLLGTFNGAVELGRAVAASTEAQDCFALRWAEFGYGRITDARDTCSLQSVRQRFAESGYDVKELLIALTQTDDFLYLPAVQP